TTIGDYAFENCSSLTSVVIPDSVTTIGDYAFSSCDSLTSVVIPDSVTTIGWGVFDGCSSLTSVVIGDGVTEIGFDAFAHCSSLTAVYYKGTASDWSSMSIGSYNYNLTDATRYYYSETQPTQEGNYWHYDENGEVAIW
ncbi:MAG: leucine-rich repeat domain-containing protein, partial [Clostridia bacterium]|nr:leucine-rich repeat domain-containing protein [Clostridia bacterium]